MDWIQHQSPHIEPLYIFSRFIILQLLHLFHVHVPTWTRISYIFVELLSFSVFGVWKQNNLFIASYFCGSISIIQLLYIYIPPLTRWYEHIDIAYGYLLECVNCADMKLLIILYEFYYSFQIGFMFCLMEITVVIWSFVGRKSWNKVFVLFPQTVVILSLGVN